MQHHSATTDRIIAGGVIAIIRTGSVEAARLAAHAIAAGGIEAIEVTMTVPGALGLLAELAAEWGDRLLLGAGTILTPEAVDLAIHAGARYVVSPHFNPATVKLCVRRGIPVMVNGQGGSDDVHFLDGSATVNSVLGFLTRSFAEIFPTDPPSATPVANPEWLALFSRLFNETQEATLASSYATVVLDENGGQQPLNVNARGVEHISFTLGGGADVPGGGAFVRPLCADAGRGPPIISGSPGPDCVTDEIRSRPMGRKTSLASISSSSASKMSA